MRSFRNAPALSHSVKDWHNYTVIMDDQGRCRGGLFCAPKYVKYSGTPEEEAERANWEIISLEEWAKRFGRTMTKAEIVHWFMSEMANADEVADPPSQPIATHLVKYV